MKYAKYIKDIDMLNDIQRINQCHLYEFDLVTLQ